MKIAFILALLLIVSASTSNAQLMDDFNDSNFTQNPRWFGSDSNFTVNQNHQLQSNALATNSTFYLSTANTLAAEAQWQFYVQLAFNTSSLNYVDIYLTASDSNLLNSNLTGYYLRLGGTNDEICLYRKDTSASIKIIDGEDGVLNATNSIFTITILSDSANKFTVTKTDLSNNTLLVGTGIDSVYQTSNYFGICIRQSTSSFFKKHYFDNISVQPITYDTISPIVDTIIVSSRNAVTVLFDEPVSESSLNLRENYYINNGVGNPDSLFFNSNNPNAVLLWYNNPLPDRIHLSLTVRNIADVSGNTIAPVVNDLFYYRAIAYDIIIDEIMADPTPSQGLPEKEWIEIRNISPFPIDLSGWCLKKNETISGLLGKHLLEKDSSVILCANSSLTDMLVLGPALGVTSFPSLNNSSDTISLLSPDKQHIHSVAYSDNWHQNDIKKLGGWSLEMIDLQKPCLGKSNWSSSENLIGGTPGKTNSVNGSIYSASQPEHWYAFANDTYTLTLYFKNTIDSNSAASLGRYHITDYNGNLLYAKPLPPLFDRIQIGIDSPLRSDFVYTVNAVGFTDCMGNAIGLNNKAKFGLTTSAAPEDIIINEILFNPKPDGYDYVELFNRSNKVINLQSLLVANRNALNQPDNIVSIQQKNRSILPGEYFVLTENPTALPQQYFVADPDKILFVDNLPSFADDEGVVLLMNNAGSIIDEFHYNEDWHFSLLNNVEGVSLERINSDAATNNKENWHSAASSVGYGTPTYKNVQSVGYSNEEEFFTIDHDVVSPDNDGNNDVLGIFYRFPENGNVLTVKVFDAMGRPVANPVRNQLCGTKGSFYWHGQDDKNRSLTRGIYILYFESYGLSGKIRKAKKAIAVK